MFHARTRSVLIIGTTLAILLTGCSGYEPRDNRPTVNGQHFKVGEAIELGNWELRVHQLTDPLRPTNRLRAPGPGHRWIRVDVELKNISTQTKSVAALLQFEVQDSKFRAYDIAVTGERGPDLDGYAPPGASRRGVIDFEVPRDAGGLILNFTSETFERGIAAVRLT